MYWLHNSIYVRIHYLKKLNTNQQCCMALLCIQSHSNNYVAIAAFMIIKCETCVILVFHNTAGDNIDILKYATMTIVQKYNN